MYITILHKHNEFTRNTTLDKHAKNQSELSLN